MKRIHMEKNDTLKSLHDDHQKALQLIEKLDRSIVGLQFEGKTSAGRHLKQIKTIMDFFLTSFSKHTQLEDQIIFPYLASHIPKVEAALPFLRTEHEALNENLKHLEALIHLFSNKPSEMYEPKIMTKFREVGAYLVFLLRHHIEAENASIYKMVQNELSSNEKKELKEKLNGKVILHVER